MGWETQPLRTCSRAAASVTWIPPSEVSLACSTGRRPWGRCRTHSPAPQLAWEYFSAPPGGVEEVAGVREVFSAQTGAPTT